MGKTDLDTEVTDSILNFAKIILLIFLHLLRLYYYMNKLPLKFLIEIKSNSF